MRKKAAAEFINKAAAFLARRQVPEARYRAFLKAAGQLQMAELLKKEKLFGMIRMERRLFQDCERVQKTVLKELLRANQDTEFGRAHHFSDIGSVKAFRRAVPVSEWSDYSEYMKRLEKGEAEILFPGKAVYFYETTGTTGAYKLIPESARDTLVREIAGTTRNMEKALACGTLGYFLRRGAKVFALASDTAARFTEGGIPSGSASGRTAMLESGGRTAALMAVPGLLANHYTDEEYSYIALRAALFYENIVMIEGNNAKLLEKIIRYGEKHQWELIEDIREGTCRLEMPEDVKKALKRVLRPAPERAEQLAALAKEGRFIPRYYWPEMRCASFWLGGSVGSYAEAVRPLLPEGVHFMELGYGASEAKVNIPLTSETPAGALMTYTGFYEFIPDGSEDEEPLMAHELEEGKDYEILLTTNSGLYRYRIHDIIHVDGFIGTTPLISFRTKAGDCANLAQEKIYGSLLQQTIREAVADSFGIRALQVYPDPEKVRYEIYIEPDREVTDTDGLSEKVDRYLRTHIEMYDWARGTALGEAEVMIMPEGWHWKIYEEYARGKANKAQVKVPVVRESKGTALSDPF